MGRSWPVVIMVSLSTLAALVILTHSAEEGLERDLLAHEVSPRLSELGSPDYDQSWRTVEVQPTMQQQPEHIEEYGGEIVPSPKRRRPGRKRKRRLQQEVILEDLTPEERRPYYADGRGLDQAPELAAVYETPDPPRRRRKRPDGRNPNRWSDNFKDQPRPLRRRGHRRKRPIVTELELSPEEQPIVPIEAFTQSQENQNEQTALFNTQLESETLNHMHIENTEAKDERKEDTKSELDKAEVQSQSDKKEIQSESDMSIADITISDHRKIEDPADHEASKEKNDKSYRVPYSLAKNQESSNGTKDLKTLLKQSGGLSLSELLQQRNLSLSDLLNGKQNAISALRSDSFDENEEQKYNEKTEINLNEKPNVEEVHQMKDEIDNYELNEHPNTHFNNEDSKVKTRRLPPIIKNKEDLEPQEDPHSTTKDIKSTDEPRRRLPPSGIRRNMRHRIKNPQVETSTLRIRPHYNYHSSHPRRKIKTTTTTESTITDESENLIVDQETNATTTTKADEEITTTVINEIITTESITTTIGTTTPKESPTEKAEDITDMSKIENIEENETVKPQVVIPALRPKLLATNSELRRQALTNRQRKKKLRNKAAIPENAEVIQVQDLFGMANLVSAAEFITKVQTTTPITTTTTEDDLPDLFQDSSENINLHHIVTDRTQAKHEKETTERSNIKLPKYTTLKQRSSTETHRIAAEEVTTEESAKEEILEVFKDMHGGARLAKILSERNMTIKELVQHRERGSSQIHLADIFHNASREPNPAEPFLSKSLIEPISKETYPLRALLEANLHDPPTKTATNNPYQAQYTNIPLIVDYGKNINENGENLGIVALFNEFTNQKTKYEKNKIKKDSEGTAYFTSVMTLNTTNENIREGRSRFENHKQSELFPSVLTDLSSEEKTPEPTLSTQDTSMISAKPYKEQDIDGDGLIVLEDLQHLNGLDNNIAQAVNEKLEVKLYETPQIVESDGFLNKFPSSVRSATIASASIVGLTMALFLLTYVGCKWRQQRNNLLHKDEGAHNERLPTPVFENRKSNRNCSNRSISPMLTSSGFTMSTLDSHTGKESPEYMWDTLHKPFQ